MTCRFVAEGRKRLKRGPPAVAGNLAIVAPVAVSVGVPVSGMIGVCVRRGRIIAGIPLPPAQSEVAP